MSSSNFYEPHLDNNQFPRAYGNNYFVNESNNLEDEYDNIDCDLLLEFFGGESAGLLRPGYDSNSYSKQNAAFTCENSSTIAHGDLSLVKNAEQDPSIPQFGIPSTEDVKERPSTLAPKAKRQKLIDEQQSTQSSFPKHQNPDSHISEKVESGPPKKAQSVVKSPTSKFIQLEASQDRRRERNKVLARKTRCKKKAEFETLRKQLSKLRTENDRLKELVKGGLPSPVTAETLTGCDVQLPDDVTKIIQAMIHFIEIADKNLLPLANPAERSFCVTNATATDNPIVYASPGFMKLTGYDMHDILGHNCRLLQGEDTDRNEVRKIRVAIEQGKEEQVVIKNYRKDGSMFWNRLQIAPIRNSMGRITLIVSLQYEVSGPDVKMVMTSLSSDRAGSPPCASQAFSDDGAQNNSLFGAMSSPKSSTTSSSSSRSCAPFSDDRSGSCSGSTSGGGSSSSGYSSNDNRSTDGVSDQGDSN